MSFTRILIIGIILLFIDWYFYQALSVVLKGASTYKKNIFLYVYYGLSIISFLILLTPTVIPFIELPKLFRIYLFSFVFIIIISKIIGSFFILTDDLIRFFRWIVSYISKSSISANAVIENTHRISRLKFLNYIALGMAALPFAGFIYGMIKGAFDYKIHKVKVKLPNLPDAFNGLKIVQISDIHAGSFISTIHIEKAVEIILAQQPDVIFFTGDLVNNIASEMQPFMQVLNKLTAPLGVYSTLGNHDYGDYIAWDNKAAKDKNLDDLKNIHAALGWRLLMNEHIIFKKENSEIALIGIENWGGNLNFPKYGDLKKAYAGTEKYPVKLLLSHDPSHWDKQVRKEFKDIDITFSGHTHGFQFGIEIPGFKWSPSQYVYKEWAGLYTEANQHIYVNRGLGFLGYPGRVGISPEITVMQLYNT